MQKIKFISDTHNDHDQLDSKSLECDILIHCGDACTKGNYTEGLNFLWWFVKQPAKYKILVPGNHCFKLRTHPDLIKLAHDMGIHVLNDDALEINGIKFYGVSQTFTSESNTKDRATSQIRRQAWENIPKNIDILLTHMPPKYILDSNPIGVHCGCTELAEKVKEVKPTYHVFGHIHHHGGKTQKVWDTEFINVAVKNELYLVVRGAKELVL